jgi:hypothetical protein
MSSDIIENCKKDDNTCGIDDGVVYYMPKRSIRLEYEIKSNFTSQKVDHEKTVKTVEAKGAVKAKDGNNENTKTTPTETTTTETTTTDITKTIVTPLNEQSNGDLCTTPSPKTGKISPLLKTEQ